MSFVWIALAVTVMSIVANQLAPAHAMAAQVSGMKGRQVTLRVWESEPEVLRVVTIHSIFAGLHFWFDAPEEGRIHLKIAQPRSATYSAGELRIEIAKYVQRNGRSLPSSKHVPAVVIVSSV